jgi:hypothetical protein
MLAARRPKDSVVAASKGSPMSGQNDWKPSPK